MDVTQTALTAYQEIKRVDAASWLGMVSLAIRNWFANWTFFLANFVIEVAEMIAGAAIYFLMGQVVAAGAAAEVGASGFDYGAYIVVGVMLNLLMQASLTVFHQSCLSCYWGNQFNTYMLYPGGLSALLFGNSIARFLTASLTTLIYLAVGVVIFRIPISFAHLPETLVVIGAAMLALSGLGLIGASTFSLLDAKSWTPNPVELVAGFGATLLAGVYFPSSVLPEWLRPLGEWLPQTHALRAARALLSGQSTLSDPAILGDLTFLLVFAAVTLPIGVWLFIAGMNKASRDGTLTRWS